MTLIYLVQVPHTACTAQENSRPIPTTNTKETTMVMKTQPGVEDTLPPGMKKPEAEGEMHMGGVHKGDKSGEGDKHLGNSSMSAAVKQLNYETERGEHCPEGVMKKD